jgi:cephalosporin-C deacetylase-like acetyl esterase
MLRRNRLIALAVCAVLSIAFAAAAQAAPVLGIHTDRADAVYTKGETVTFTITMTDAGKPVATADLPCDLSTDNFQNSEKKSVTITDGKGELQASRAEPCILWLRASYPQEAGRPVVAVGGAAFSPLEIQPSMPAPDDFDQFWADQKKRVDAIPVNAQLTPMDAGSSSIELYAITMDNINDTKIYGYLAKPKGDGPFPALLQVQWAGVYSLHPDWITGRAAQGFLALDINAHAIENGKPDQYYKDMDAGALKGYPYQGRESRDTCYFLRMYLSCYRAAEYLAARPDWDKKHLIAVGGSQGGGQTLVIAGLDPRVTAAAANVPAMCDHTARAIGRAPGWPMLVATSGGVPDPTQLQVSRYFDAVNFAREIKVPAIVGTGFADTTCPSSSVYAAYNVIQGPKKMILDPLSGHGGAKPNWDAAYEVFLKDQSHSGPEARTN